MRLYALRRHCQGQTLTYRQVQISIETQTLAVRNILCAAASINHTTKPTKKKSATETSTITIEVKCIFSVGKSRRQQKAFMIETTSVRCVAYYVRSLMYICMWKKNSIHLAKQEHTPTNPWHTGLYTERQQRCKCAVVRILIRFLDLHII